MAEMNPSDVLRAKLNLETAQLAWPELERHFARGDVIKVAVGMDLIEAAQHVAENKADRIQAWLTEGRIARADLGDARDWHTRKAVFWVVVVAPWVLVQETGKQAESST